MNSATRTAATQTYATWHREPGKDGVMADGHLPYWRHFINIVPETDLSTKVVLDFGCNQGGFLRLLHAVRPFRRAVGIDIARESVAVAQSLTGGVPVEHHVATDLAPWADSIDIAFSYEVIYLLPDLRYHAEQMRRVLRPGGVYYAVTGCHTASSVWPRFRKVIAETSSAPVQDYAPDDFTAAFAAVGLGVGVKKFRYDGFVPAVKDNRYYATTTEAINYAAEDKLVFRITQS